MGPVPRRGAGHHGVDQHAVRAECGFEVSAEPEGDLGELAGLVGEPGEQALEAERKKLRSARVRRNMLKVIELKGGNFYEEK